MSKFYKNEVNRLDQEALKDQKRVDQEKADLIKKIKLMNVDVLAKKEFLDKKPFLNRFKNSIIKFFNKF